MKDFHCVSSPHSHSPYEKCRKLFFPKKIPVTTTRGSSMHFQYAGYESILQPLLSHFTLLQLTKIFKSSGIECKHVNLRNIRTEGKDKEHNNCEDKTEAKTLLTFSTTTLNH